ncbi:MAG: winged helix-turn-helix domain-containing protein [Chloroflexota bacterium]
MRRLTSDQYQVYHYLASYIEHKGYSPLATDIAEALRMDVITVERTLWHLRDWGYVTTLSPHSQMLYLTMHIPQVATADEIVTRPQRKRVRQGKRRAKPSLTNKNRQRIYQFIGKYVAQNHYPPALRDIAGDLDIGLTTVRYHVDRLRDAGYLTVVPGRSRSIRLTDKPFIATKADCHATAGD